MLTQVNRIFTECDHNVAHIIITPQNVIFLRLFAPVNQHRTAHAVSGTEVI